MERGLWLADFRREEGPQLGSSRRKGGVKKGKFCPINFYMSIPPKKIIVEEYWLWEN